MNERRELLEPFGVPDVFVSGLANVESIGGGCYRFTFFTTQDISGSPEMIVSARIIMSGEALPEAITMAARMTNMCACENVRKLAIN